MGLLVGGQHLRGGLRCRDGDGRRGRGCVAAGGGAAAGERADSQDGEGGQSGDTAAGGGDHGTSSFCCQLSGQEGTPAMGRQLGPEGGEARTELGDRAGSVLVRPERPVHLGGGAWALGLHHRVPLEPMLVTAVRQGPGEVGVDGDPAAAPGQEQGGAVVVGDQGRSEVIGREETSGADLREGRVRLRPVLAPEALAVTLVRNPLLDRRSARSTGLHLEQMQTAVQVAARPDLETAAAAERGEAVGQQVGGVEVDRAVAELTVVADLEHAGGARQHVEDLVELLQRQQVLAVDPGEQSGPLGQLRQADRLQGGDHRATAVSRPVIAGSVGAPVVR